MTAVPADSRLPRGRIVNVPSRGEMFVRDHPGPPGAPTIVLLHGWTSTADITWYGAFDPLGERFRVLAPDLRGHGRGPRQGRKARLDDVVDDIAALIEALGVAPAVVAGYSLGGAITQRLARERSDLVAGVVLCASASRFTAAPVSKRSVLAMNLICRLAALLPDSLSAAVAEVTMRLLYGSDGFQSWALPRMRRHRWSNVLYLAADLAVYDSSDWIGDIEAPVAVLMTGGDVYVPAERQAHLAGACNARVFEMPGGHSACLSDPERFASLLVQACEHILGAEASPCGPSPGGSPPAPSFRARPA